VGYRRTSIKILFFHGTGICIFHERLDRGQFEVPTSPAERVTHVEVDDAVLEILLDGISIEQSALQKWHLHNVFNNFKNVPEKFVTDPLPKEAVRRERLAPSMVAHILTSEYAS
jgi:IS66 Orf2 like protein